METDAMSHFRRLEYLFLLLVPLAPLGFLLLIARLSRGKDLTVVFYTGSALLLIVGGLLVWSGNRSRRSGRTWSGAITIVFVVLLGLLDSEPMYWGGRSEKAVTVVVIDGETGQPVADAAVWFHKWEQASERPNVRTDNDGRVDLIHQFKAAGTASFHKSRGSVWFRDKLVSVEAEGYEPFTEDLEVYLGKARSIHDKAPLPPVEVRLKRKRSGPPEPVTAETLLRIVENEALALDKRGDAAAELVQFKTPEVIDRLGKLLPGKGNVLEVEILSTLGQFGDPRALPALQRVRMGAVADTGKINAVRDWAIKQCQPRN